MISVDKAVEILNEAFEADPDAIKHLMSVRVNCNATLAEHPTIQVIGTSWGDKPCPMVGILGVINGIFGADAETWGAIAAKFSGEGELLGFVNNGRAVGH